MTARVLPRHVVEAIEKTYSWAEASSTEARGVSLGMDQSVNFGMLVAMIDAIPEELLPQRPEDRTVFVAAVGAMRAAERRWASGGHEGHSVRLSPLGATAGKHPVAALADVLRRAPDEAPAINEKSLQFVQSAEARNALRTDMSTAARALANSEYKASAVVAGSVIEALLYWALQQTPAALQDQAFNTWEQEEPAQEKRIKHLRKTAVESWHLADLIQFASRLQIITELQVQMANVAREFRNLIHPGRVMKRDGVNCSHGEAHAALGAMYEVAEHLERRYGS